MLQAAAATSFSLTPGTARKPSTHIRLITQPREGASSSCNNYGVFFLFRFIPPHFFHKFRLLSHRHTHNGRRLRPSFRSVEFVGMFAACWRAIRYQQNNNARPVSSRSLSIRIARALRCVDLDVLDIAARSVTNEDAAVAGRSKAPPSAESLMNSPQHYNSAGWLAIEWGGGVLECDPLKFSDSVHHTVFSVSAER